MLLEQIPYRLKKNSRSRSLRLAVLRDGTVTVTVPHRVSHQQADAFVQSKRDWLIEKIQYVQSLPQHAVTKFTVADYQRRKEEARDLITKLVQRYAEQDNFSYSRITIRNQKTCWGSCSRKKTLSFNYKILFLPPMLQEYIVVHELCHLKEMNHSPKFWALVELIIPEYTVRRNELRRISFSK